MEESKTIPHEIGGVRNDAFRFGLQGVKSDIVGSHPLESAYHSVISFLLTIIDSYAYTYVYVSELSFGNRRRLGKRR